MINQRKPGSTVVNKWNQDFINAVKTKTAKNLTTLDSYINRIKNGSEDHHNDCIYTKMLSQLPLGICEG